MPSMWKWKGRQAIRHQRARVGLDSSDERARWVVMTIVSMFRVDVKMKSVKTIQISRSSVYLWWPFKFMYSEFYVNIIL